MDIERVAGTKGTERKREREREREWSTHRVAKTKNRDLHYTSLPRDKLPLNSTMQSHLAAGGASSVSLSLLFFASLPFSRRDTRASLMQLARGTAFDASRAVWPHCFFYDAHYACKPRRHRVLNNTEQGTLYKTVPAIRERDFARA